MGNIPNSFQPSLFGRRTTNLTPILIHFDPFVSSVSLWRNSLPWPPFSRSKEPRILIFMPAGKNSKMRRESADFIRRHGKGAPYNLGDERVHREEDFLACYLPQRDCFDSRSDLVFDPGKSVDCQGGLVINPEANGCERKGGGQPDRLQSFQLSSSCLVAPLQAGRELRKRPTHLLGFPAQFGCFSARQEHGVQSFQFREIIHFPLAKEERQHWKFVDCQNAP